MAPSHVRVAARVHVKQLTWVNVGQPLSSEITHPGCRPRGPKEKAILGNDFKLTADRRCAHLAETVLSGLRGDPALSQCLDDLCPQFQNRRAPF